MNKSSYVTFGVPFAMYLVMVVTVVLLLVNGRRWARGVMATPVARKNWELWREDVRRQNDPQAVSVARRVPKSAEPPALVLMRDYFAVCLVGAVGFSSLIYFVVVWLAVEVLRSSRK